MYAFKGFDENLKCRDFQYEVGKTYVLDDGPPILCKWGFHYCLKLEHVLSYYPVFWKSRYCIVYIPDDAKTQHSKIPYTNANVNLRVPAPVEDTKGVTDKMSIVKEITEDVRKAFADNIVVHTFKDPLLSELIGCNTLVGGMLPSCFGPLLIDCYTKNIGKENK